MNQNLSLFNISYRSYNEKWPQKPHISLRLKVHLYRKTARARKELRHQPQLINGCLGGSYIWNSILVKLSDEPHLIPHNGNPLLELGCRRQRYFHQ